MATPAPMACNARMRTVARLHLAPVASRVVVAFVLAATTATAVLVSLLSLPWWLRALLVALCAGQCAWALAVRYRGAPERVVVGVDRRVAFTDGRGEVREARVLDAT